MKIISNENLDDLNLIKHALIHEGFLRMNLMKQSKKYKKCDLSPGLNYKKVKYIEPDLKIILMNNDLKVVS